MVLQLPPKPKGIAQVAFEAYVLGSSTPACQAVGIDIRARKDLRMVQLLGYAEKSKGFHAKDGTLNGEDYCAAGDFSVRGYSDSQIATWIDELAPFGWYAFFRDPDDAAWRNNGHIHAVYCGVPMKPQLQSQVRDFKRGLNGLVSHRPIDRTFYPTPELVNIGWEMFKLSNPEKGRGKVVRSPLALKKTQPPAPAISYGLYLGNNTKPSLWMPTRNGAALAPIRAFGSALEAWNPGLETDVVWDPKSKKVTLGGKEIAAAITPISGVGHAPIRALAWASGLHLETIDNKNRRIVIDVDPK